MRLLPQVLSVDSILFFLGFSLSALFTVAGPDLFANIVYWSGGAETTDAAWAASPVIVKIAENGLQLLTTHVVEQRDFKQEVCDVGLIDFDQDMTAPIFPSYQGKVIDPLVDLGQHVDKGQILYTINSPDLLQAEATLIQTAGVLNLTTRNLARLRQSVKNGGGAQKDLDQAQSDQQTAVGSYKAAKLALSLFGKTESDADHIAESRTIDPILAVRSPIAGAIVTRNAAPGMLVQPGTAPAPYTVADLSHVRMYDYVSEDESPAIRIGQDVTGHIAAYPDRVFSGKVTAVAAAVDPNTHRLQVESQIANPDNVLRPNMYADLTIQTGAPIRSLAVPTDAVVRLGDGTMTVWVATSSTSFTQRVVKVGLQQNNFDQILDGLKAGETVVTHGAVFVSNIANANASP